jgi:hypothetical protein
MSRPLSFYLANALVLAVLILGLWGELRILMALAPERFMP